MRRGGMVGGVGGGFSKPPLAPPSHGTGRPRLAHELNGVISKDRSPRERSPGLMGSLALSSSMPGSREKSPNPSAQDLHDCSMCLSAYVQSLNTMCGTACRLSQCLSQVALETCGVESTPLHGCRDTQLPQHTKETAEIWENLARAVGVASAAVKTQMAMLLQELQGRQDLSDALWRQETAKVVQSVLGTFLSLQHQFSTAIIDRFSSIMLSIRVEENGYGNNSTNSNTTSLALTNGSVGSSSQAYSGSSSSQQEMPFAMSASQQQQQQQSDIGVHSSANSLYSVLPGQLSRGQPNGPQAPIKNGTVVDEDKSKNRQSSSGHGRQLSGWIGSNSLTGGSTLPGGNALSSSNTNPGGSTLSPSIMSLSNHESSQSLLSVGQSPSNTSTLGGFANYNSYYSQLNPGLGWIGDAISRRWSMGGLSAEGWDRSGSSGGGGGGGSNSGGGGTSGGSGGGSGGNSLGPFSLMANRRWSVPEATEHDLSGVNEQDSYLGDNQLGNYGLQGDYSSALSAYVGAWGGSKRLHVPSRDSSITRSPSHSRSVTPDPARQPTFVSHDELDDIIELLSIPSLNDKAGNSEVNTRATSPSAAQSPNQLQSIIQLFEEASKQQQQQQQQQQHHQQQQQAQQGKEPQHQQQQLKSKNQQQKLLMESSQEEGENSQVSTPLWPPSGMVPDDLMDVKRGNPSALCRDAPNRASWPASHLLWNVVDSCTNGSEGDVEETGPPIQYRRHSTDTTHLNPQPALTSLANKTRSSDSLMGHSSLQDSSCLDANLHHLLLLNSLLPPPSATTTTSVSTNGSTSPTSPSAPSSLPSVVGKNGTQLPVSTYSLFRPSV